jgi:hypothetical protein
MERRSADWHERAYDARIRASQSLLATGDWPAIVCYNGAERVSHAAMLWRM